MRQMVRVPALVLLLFAAPVMAQAVGGWVLAPSSTGGYLVPGIVTGTSGQTLTLQFEDGSSKTMLASEVQPLGWTAGSQVECRGADGEWQDVTIASMAADGKALGIRQTTDGAVRTTTIGSCRTPQYP